MLLVPYVLGPVARARSSAHSRRARRIQQAGLAIRISFEWVFGKRGREGSMGWPGLPDMERDAVECKKMERNGMKVAWRCELIV